MMFHAALCLVCVLHSIRSVAVGVYVCVDVGAFVCLVRCCLSCLLPCLCRCCCCYECEHDDVCVCVCDQLVREIAQCPCPWRQFRDQRTLGSRGRTEACTRHCVRSQTGVDWLLPWCLSPCPATLLSFCILYCQ